MSTNIIKINRGDSFSHEIRIPEVNNYTNNHLLEDNEVVYFALLYPNQPFEEAILIDGYTREEQDDDTGEITITLSASETRKLAPGIYYYTVKLQRGGTLNDATDLDEPDEVRTIIERTKFIVNE